MANEWEPDTVFDVWADDRARQIILATGEEPRSVEELAECCEGSLSSLYRRVDVLTDIGLLEEHIEIGDDGHHRNVYQRACDRIRVEIDDSGFVVDLGETTASSPPQTPGPRASRTD